jgi:PKD repeat protein
MKLKINSLRMLIGLGAALALGNGCTPDKMDSGATAAGPAPESSFTMTQLGSNPNKYVVAAKTTNVLAVKWDKGDGAGPVFGKTTDTLFFPDAGNYTVSLTAIGKGGLSSVSSKQLTIANSDPNAGNLVQGGKMDAGDQSKWTLLNIGSPAINWTLANGKYTATGGGWGHTAIYQAIQVQANKDYRFSMLVSGSGATDVWFEVYFGSTAPVQNNDYSSDGIRLGLNTWTGCGNTPFNGNLNAIGCTGSLVGKNGVVKFTTSGTIYLLIKTGGLDLGTTGISIDNVELRGL